MNREEWKIELLGAMVAVARACEGNKNRPDSVTHNAMLSALYMTIPGTGLGEQQAERVWRSLRAEKEKLVPRSPDCADPCDGNDTFSMYELDELGPPITMLKETLLMGLMAMEPLLRGQIPEALFADAMQLLYDGFYILGDECEAKELATVLAQMDMLRTALLHHMLQREGSTDGCTMHKPGGVADEKTENPH